MGRGTSREGGGGLSRAGAEPPAIASLRVADGIRDAFARQGEAGGGEAGDALEARLVALQERAARGRRLLRFYKAKNPARLATAGAVIAGQLHDPALVHQARPSRQRERESHALRARGRETERQRETEGDREGQRETEARATPHPDRARG
jgi:hypothetical protein